MLALHKRSYNIGDVVLVAGYGNPDQPGGVNCLASATRWNPDWVRRANGQGIKIILLEGVVESVAAGRAGDDDGDDSAAYINIRFSRGAHYHNVGFTLDAQSVQYTATTAANNLMRIGLEQAAAEFMLDFAYPAVVTSQGYNSMLRDLAVAVGREPDAVVVPEDSKAIYTKATEFGIPVIKLPTKHLSQSFSQQSAERVEAQYNATKTQMITLVVHRDQVNAARGGVRAAELVPPPVAVDRAAVNRWNEGGWVAQQEGIWDEVIPPVQNHQEGR